MLGVRLRNDCAIVGTAYTSEAAPGAHRDEHHEGRQEEGKYPGAYPSGVAIVAVNALVR